jgi:hypothetical protein
MTYSLNSNGSISLSVGDGVMFLPGEDNGTPEWSAYKAWLEEGNTPLPADPIPEPEPLTPEEKLAQSGLTVEELKELLGL